MYSKCSCNECITNACVLCIRTRKASACIIGVHSQCLYNMSAQQMLVYYAYVCVEQMLVLYKCLANAHVILVYSKY